MTNILKLNSNGSVTLCARKTCCPVIEKINNEMIRITDDNGNSIIIEKEQARLINDALDLMDNKQVLLCE